MFLWFIALSILGVFAVFRDPAIDYRLIALGAVLPDPVDAVLVRRLGPMHSVVVAVGLLILVMLATIGRRSVRRRSLAVPIGVFAHLVLDGAWAATEAFWWPVAGAIPRVSLPFVQRGPLVIALMELVGVAALVFGWRRFGFDRPDRRRRFLRTGRLDRTLI